MRRKSVATVVGVYVLLLSGFLLVETPQTRRTLLFGALFLVAATSAYFIWALGSRMWRDLEDGA